MSYAYTSSSEVAKDRMIDQVQQKQQMREYIQQHKLMMYSATALMLGSLAYTIFTITTAKKEENDLLLRNWPCLLPYSFSTLPFYRKTMIAWALRTRFPVAALMFIFIPMPISSLFLLNLMKGGWEFAFMHTLPYLGFGIALAFLGEAWSK